MINSETGGESGVSPVLGVILMVAITVIVAAIIGSFVLNTAEGSSTTPQAGVTVDEIEDESLTLKITTPGNLDKVVIIAPQGQRFKETPAQASCCSTGGWPDEAVTGEFKTTEDDREIVNENPRAGDRMVIGDAAREMDIFLGSSDHDNLRKGDVITVVGFTDGERAVLTEHVVSSEEIAVDD